MTMTQPQFCYYLRNLWKHVIPCYSVCVVSIHNISYSTNPPTPITIKNKHEKGMIATPPCCWSEARLVRPVMGAAFASWECCSLVVDPDNWEAGTGWILSGSICMPLWPTMSDRMVRWRYRHMLDSWKRWQGGRWRANVSSIMNLSLVGCIGRNHESCRIFCP